ncbi:zinc finger BED domain-containing protein 4-like [Tachysurus ichikawai]
MKKAMDDLRVPSLGCVTHSLQLVVNEGLLSQGSVSDVIASARKIVGHFKHSPLAYSRLQDLQRKFQMPLKRLQQDIKTRWNSRYYTIQSISEQKRTLCVWKKCFTNEDAAMHAKNALIQEVEKMEKTLKRTATTALATAADPAEMVSHAEASGEKLVYLVRQEHQEKRAKG